ncbi:MAG: hypothetical protein CM15mP115_18230 [Alphaproteobacteria bacterium]|nr:MAG: hypothetical protein CM15mP115_18230 [Alphaproteobacteria bacterium]
MGRPGPAAGEEDHNACAGGDLVPFVDAAARRDPGAPLFMMAHSLGGTAALNMALDFPGAAARLAGIVTIGTPLDMVATSRRFSRLRNLAYGRHMLSALKQLAGDAPDIREDTLAAAVRAKHHGIRRAGHRADGGLWRR